MKEVVQTAGRVDRILRTRSRHRHWVVVVMILAVLVSSSTFYALKYNATAQTYQKRILDCPYESGTVSHIHNDDCYMQGKLICQVEEIPVHEHSATCYEDMLICPLEESEGHVHTEECWAEVPVLVCEEEHEHSETCYAMETQLVCGMEEGEGAHHHEESCYASALICEKPVLPEHMHTTACFRMEEMTPDEIAARNGEALPEEEQQETPDEILPEEENEPAEPESEPHQEAVLEEEETETEAYPAQIFSGAIGSIHVNVEADEGAFPQGTVMVLAEVLDQDTLDTAGAAVDGEVVKVLAVDITFKNAAGEEIEPLIPIRVSMTPVEGTDPVIENERPEVVHIDREGETKVMDQQNDETTVSTGAIFEAESFSVYALVYTVDFHYEVDGQVYEYSLQGGSFITLQQLVDRLGIAECTEENTALRSGPVSDTAKRFVANVEKAEFSDPSLIWVGKADVLTTVGQLKEANGISVQYSAELAEEEIAGIDAQTIDADDWALISLQPFTTEESLTVTMKNGDVFTVRVTDAQIRKTMISAKGETYEITVTYDEDAGIPDGAELVVREIEEDSEEYLQCLGKAWSKINTDYLEREKNSTGEDAGNNEASWTTPNDPLYVRNILQAVFFDISFLYDGEEFEPQAPVQVEIHLIDGLNSQANAQTDIVHFMGERTDLIPEAEAFGTDERVAGFRFEQDSFSVDGFITSVEADGTVSVPVVLRAGTSENATPEPPQANKWRTENNDGTYKLHLSVTGSAQSSEQVKKSNVIIIMDESSSMYYGQLTKIGTCTNGTPDFTPDPNLPYYYPQSGGSQGGINGAALEYSNGKLYIPGGFLYGPSLYTGDVYTFKNRLNYEQEALGALVHSLLLNNKAGVTADGTRLDDIVEIAVVGFNRRAWVKTDWSTSESDLVGEINKNELGNETHWWDALNTARSLASAKHTEQPDEDVHILFLTDGRPLEIVLNPFNPTPEQYDNKCVPSVQNLMRLGDYIHLYNIYTYGALIDQDNAAPNPGDTNGRYPEKQRLQDLTEVAKQLGDASYHDANTVEDLQHILGDILGKISNSVAYGRVSIIDGLTANAAATALVSGRADGFTYSVSGARNYTVTATGGESPTVTFTINGQPYTTSEIKTGPDNKPYYSVTVDGSEYKMTLASFSDIKDGVDAESHVYNRKAAVVITVEKAWEPLPDNNATVTVELHRYAKIRKGTISVTLYDTNEAPIEGAVFELYKDGQPTETEVTTNVNGIASVSGLEAGTYKLVQKSTPTGYSMDGHTTETGTLTVEDNVTTPQTLDAVLTNTALVTAGKVTLTLTDSGTGSGVAGAPIAGATFTLYKDSTVYNSGYVTNSEGKVVVGNLDAGEYYFIQTGTTSDYNLPNVRRTESFTVLDQPGIPQTFTQSMTNSLKGKGTVSLTLKKESGEAISGATFQLKQGNTVIETKTTGSDGTLTFTSALYEGSYTVHQVDTGSAGGDYATAADQNVTIEANSVTTQQKSLTFENEEAAGNNTVSVYRGQGTNAAYGYCNNGDQTPFVSKTGLKAGDAVQIKISRKQEGHQMGYCTDYMVSNQTGLGTWVQISSWTGNDFILEFVIPADATDQTFNIGIISGWGKDEGSVSFVEASTSYALSSVQGRSASNGLRTLAAAKPDTAEYSSNSITHSNASPAAAPEGYATDSTFVVPYTLTSTDNWKHTFEAQDKYDADGNPYYYYVVETACSDEDYWIASYSGDSLNESGTITITNKKEDKGSITVTKSFSGLDALPESFQITNNYNSDVFTVGNATSGDGTSENPYTWIISGIPDNTEVVFTETGATVDGYVLTVTSKGTVVADSTVSATAVIRENVTAEFVNTYLKTGDITLKKVDQGDLDEENPNLLKGASFTLSKYLTEDFRAKDTDWGIEGTKTLTDEKNLDGTYTLNGVFTFTELTVGYYQLEETKIPAGYVKIAGNPTFKIEADESNNLTITLINNPGNLLRLVDGELTIMVGNTPGVQLPQTGGIGTTCFTELGGLMTATAGAILALLSYRRRKKQHA